MTSIITDIDAKNDINKFKFIKGNKKEKEIQVVEMVKTLVDSGAEQG